MLKARHVRSDTSFNDLLRILADTNLESNKVPTNTYQAKKLIQPVVMKLKMFHACPNHYILYRGKYEKLQSYLHCGVSWYKRNVGYRLDKDDEGASRGRRRRRLPRRVP